MDCYFYALLFKNCGKFATERKSISDNFIHPFNWYPGIKKIGDQ